MLFDADGEGEGWGWVTGEGGESDGVSSGSLRWRLDPFVGHLKKLREIINCVCIQKLELYDSDES